MIITFRKVTEYRKYIIGTSQFFVDTLLHIAIRHSSILLDGDTVWYVLWKQVDVRKLKLDVSLNYLLGHFVQLVSETRDSFFSGWISEKPFREFPKMWLQTYRYFFSKY